MAGFGIRADFPGLALPPEEMDRIRILDLDDETVSLVLKAIEGIDSPIELSTDASLLTLVAIWQGEKAKGKHADKKSLEGIEKAILSANDYAQGHYRYNLGAGSGIFGGKWDSTTTIQSTAKFRQQGKQAETIAKLPGLENLKDRIIASVVLADVHNGESAFGRQFEENARAKVMHKKDAIGQMCEKMGAPSVANSPAQLVDALKKALMQVKEEAGKVPGMLCLALVENTDARAPSMLAVSYATPKADHDVQLIIFLKKSDAAQIARTLEENGREALAQLLQQVNPDIASIAPPVKLAGALLGRATLYENAWQELMEIRLEFERKKSANRHDDEPDPGPLKGGAAAKMNTTELGHRERPQSRIEHVNPLPPFTLDEALDGEEVKEDGGPGLLPKPGLKRPSTNEGKDRSATKLAFKMMISQIDEKMEKIENAVERAKQEILDGVAGIIRNPSRWEAADPEMAKAVPNIDLKRIRLTSEEQQTYVKQTFEIMKKRMEFQSMQARAHEIVETDLDGLSAGKFLAINSELTDISIAFINFDIGAVRAGLTPEYPEKRIIRDEESGESTRSLSKGG